MIKRLVPIAICLVLMSSPAWAAKLYIGGSWGEGSVEINDRGSRVDLDDNGFKVFAGWEFGRFLALEVGFTDLGKLDTLQSGTQTEAKADIISAEVVGTLPATARLDLFAKLGAANWDAEVTVTEPMFTDTYTTDGTDIKYGFGASYLLTQKLGIRFELETYDFDDVDDVRFTSLGLQFSF